MLDTHTLRWMLQGNRQRGAVARQVIFDTANDLHWSIASVREDSINISIGKLDVAADCR